MTRPLRIAVLASARHPIAEPFAGGLEAHTWTLVRGLRERGHEVTLFAGPGSDPELDARVLPVEWPSVSAAARRDVSMPAPAFLAEHHAYLQVLLAMADEGTARYDVVHNNSLHYLPVAMGAALRTPVLTTLHTPPTPWLESAVQLNRRHVHFVAVSRHTAHAWRASARDVPVIRNGVDLDRWPRGPGGGPAVWFGRIVPEKGTHLALAAALAADEPLDIAGPIADEGYFADSVRPLLDERRRYVGHLRGAELAALVGRAAVCVVTPRWDEPYGLVVAEALACGTPVAAFDRGAVREIVDRRTGILVPADDTGALATAIAAARNLSRVDARRRAERHLSHRRMVERYCARYGELTALGAA